MALPRGSIVIGDDPYNENSVRPMAIINSQDHPFHGSQYIATAISRQQYNNGVLLKDDYLDVECPGLKDESYVLPWSVISINADEIHQTIAHLEPYATDAIVEELITYITGRNRPNLSQGIPSPDRDMKSVGLGLSK